jgi:hypothetical protein
MYSHSLAGKHRSTTRFSIATTNINISNKIEEFNLKDENECCGGGEVKHSRNVYKILNKVGNHTILNEQNARKRGEKKT